MIKEKTVFILGAGSSFPYGFPVGKVLRKNIIDSFQSIFRHSKEFSQAAKKVNYIQLFSFDQSFEESSNKSIDLFLSRNPDFEDLGKMAIAYYIKEAERTSVFNDDVNQSEDWYSYLFDVLNGGIFSPNEYKKFNSNEVFFISFNYDRSLEYFIYNALKNSYMPIRNMSFNNIIKEFQLPVYHVYGDLGDLSVFPYGGKVAHPIYIEEYCKNIRTIYSDRGEIEVSVLDKINQAKRIIFLGFSYQTENLDILKIDKWNINIPIYGTALGFNEGEINQIEKRLWRGTVQPKIKNCNCLDLLKGLL